MSPNVGGSGSGADADTGGSTATNAQAPNDDQKSKIGPLQSS